MATDKRNARRLKARGRLSGGNWKFAGIIIGGDGRDHFYVENVNDEVTEQASGERNFATSKFQLRRRPPLPPAPLDKRAIVG